MPTCGELQTRLVGPGWGNLFTWDQLSSDRSCRPNFLSKHATYLGGITQSSNHIKWCMLYWTFAFCPNLICVYCVCVVR